MRGLSTFNGGPDNCPARPEREPCRPRCRCPFNGGPDNCPARLLLRCGRCLGARLPSMEGRTIARPDHVLQAIADATSPPSMEGRTIARPDESEMTVESSVIKSLQWRAGQLPGQTVTPRPELSPLHAAFNGGPDNCPARLDKGVREVATLLGPSMEGRTIARPDQVVDRCDGGRRLPSMEGRTIARPDPARRWGGPRRAAAFNGGPDNCPARPSTPRLRWCV